MCRFALYLGPPVTVSSLVTEPENSIIHQSYHSHERAEPLNGDGFGIAWYVPELSDRPAVFKDISPAWNNLNLINLASVTRSGCVLAHVRAATPGLPVSRLNCHPFGWEAFSFMHNGHIGGFQQLLRRLRESLSDESYLKIQGNTDSEHVFALFVDHWRRAGGDGDLAAGDRLERMVAALTAAVRDVEQLRLEMGVDEPSLLNLALADGRRAVVTRYISRDPERANSLYVHSGSGYVCEDGLLRMLPPESDGEAVIVASEPLDTSPGWQRVPPNHLVTVDERLRVELWPMEAFG